MSPNFKQTEKSTNHIETLRKWISERHNGNNRWLTASLTSLCYPDSKVHGANTGMNLAIRVVMLTLWLYSPSFPVQILRRCVQLENFFMEGKDPFVIQISWMLMSWRPTESGQQQPWYMNSFGKFRLSTRRATFVCQSPVRLISSFVL